MSLLTLYTKSDSKAEFSNSNLSKRSFLDFVSCTYWEPHTLLIEKCFNIKSIKAQTCNDTNMYQKACVHERALRVPLMIMSSSVAVRNCSQSLQSVMDRFPRKILPRSMEGKLILGNLILGMVNLGIWMFPNSIFGKVIGGIWNLERSTDGIWILGICILEKSSLGNEIFCKSILGNWKFGKSIGGIFTSGNLTFGNRIFETLLKKSKKNKKDIKFA